MPVAQVTPDLDMFYQVDDFVAPWGPRETVLLLHGNSESGEVWYGWMSRLAEKFRVVRPDMRGFGKSSPMPRDYGWTVDGIIDDFIALMDLLAIDRFHLVGAKIAGTIAMRFAARHPDRVLTLTVVGTLTAGKQSLGARFDSWLEHLEKHGVESWARWTMPGRLGSDFPPDGYEWWTRLMGRTALSTQLGFMPMVPSIDVAPDLSSIACPTLVITTEGSNLGSVEATRAWTATIPRGELLVLPGASYHSAATDPQRCAAATVDFISRFSAAPAAPA